MGGTALRGRVAAVLLVAAGVLALVLSTVPAPAAASTTTLTVIAGSASVTRGAARSVSAGDNEIVRGGDEIRTSVDGHAVLTFVDGSTLTLEPSASVTVQEVSTRSGSTVVRVFQTLGLTWASVDRLLSPGSRFEVATRSATASVRGTAFEVEVFADLTTRVRTSEGTVAVSNALGEVIVREGTETYATPRTPPAPPVEPPPSTRRAIEIGDRAVVIVDAFGRGCGVHQGQAVEQIPGCVVRNGHIEIQDTARAGDYRLAVTEPLPTDSTVIERTVAVGVRPEEPVREAVREVVLPSPELAKPPVQVAPRTEPPLHVTLPLVGTIPVQLAIPSAAPAGGPDSAPVATRAPSPPAGLVQQLTLPPIPFGRSAAPTTAPPAAPSLAPLPSIEGTPRVTAAPTIVPRVVPTAVPTVRVPPSPSPTLPPTLAPTLPPASAPTLPQVQTSVPSVHVSPIATPGPTSSPAPTAAPIPTPAPTPTPTKTPCPLNLLGIPLCF